MGQPITVTDGTCFAFPDVCLTPAPPAPPVPVPYPNIAQLSQATGTATTVNAGGKPVVTEGSSIPASSGDEAGANGGVTSGSIKGECKFTTFSTTVKANGKGIVRLGDSTTQNNQNAVGSVLGGLPNVLVGDEMSEFLGRGWAFPIRVNARGGLDWSEGAQSIEEATWIILATPRRSRIMAPEFGCGLQDYVFAPNNANTRSVIAAEVRAALIRSEPRVDVLAVKAEPQLDAQNTLLIEVNYRIRANNALRNIVYPFFLNEGSA